MSSEQDPSQSNLSQQIHQPISVRSDSSRQSASEPHIMVAWTATVSAYLSLFFALALSIISKSISTQERLGGVTARKETA